MREGFAVQLRRYEVIGGILWLLVYQFLIGYVLELIFGLINVNYDLALLNGVYFFVNFGVTIIIFRRFLAYSLPVVAEHPLKFLRGLLVGFCAYWVLGVCLSALEGFLGIDPWIPNDDTVAEIAGVSYKVMWVGAVLLSPLTEETLMRGLIFGSVRRKSRILAYIVTAVAFALIHTLDYLMVMAPLTLGYNVLVYGLPSVALCICYELSGSIWGPIVLHVIINALGMSAV